MTDNVANINNPPSYTILNTGTEPIGLPELNSNSCLVIQHNQGIGNYTAQLAFLLDLTRLPSEEKPVLTVGLNGNILQLNKIARAKYRVVYRCYGKIKIVLVEDRD